MEEAMKTNPTSAQETSLRKLFHGTQQDVRQVIAVQRPELQSKIHDLIRAKGNFDKLLQIMFSDLKRTTEAMKASPNDQYWRRAAIRDLVVTIDGIIYCLKQSTLPMAELNEVKFNSKDIAFLRERIEQNGQPAKTKFVKFRDNFKGTFKLMAEACKCACPTDFNDAGFAALCDTYELRHRLVHPKDFMTFCVSNVEKEKAAVAINWLSQEANRLFSTCRMCVGPQSAGS
jgi:hypothetical protein